MKTQIAVAITEGQWSILPIPKDASLQGIKLFRKMVELGAPVRHALIFMAMMDQPQPERN